MALLNGFCIALTLLAGTLGIAQAASLQKVTEDFGSNPRNVGFYIYVPDVLAPRPPILVNPHWCHGDARACHAGSQYAALADRYGFIVVYPDSPNAADKCWDVSSNATLAHDAGGDSLGIASMARWALARYGGDRDRVFVTGVSSGAMMTNVLVGAYPDLFAAGSAFAGVPFGCFADRSEGGYGTWSDACAKGKVTHTGAEWAEMVRGAYPGYNGWRPKMQVFHGTADEVLNYVNFGEEVKQWTSMLGLSETPTNTITNTPVSGWTKSVYGPTGWFEAYSATGVSHNIQNQEAVVMKWFDLTCTAGDCFKWGKGS
ncbi:carbohydrate esterase family 1 protein [Apiospora arundinis]